MEGIQPSFLPPREELQTLKQFLRNVPIMSPFRGKAMSGWHMWCNGTEAYTKKLATMSSVGGRFRSGPQVGKVAT